MELQFRVSSSERAPRSKRREFSVHQCQRFQFPVAAQVHRREIAFGAGKLFQLGEILDSGERFDSGERGIGIGVECQLFDFLGFAFG